MSTLKTKGLGGGPAYPVSSKLVLSYPLNQSVVDGTIHGGNGSPDMDEIAPTASDAWSRIPGSYAAPLAGTCRPHKVTTNAASSALLGDIGGMDTSWLFSGWMLHTKVPDFGCEGVAYFAPDQAAGGIKFLTFTPTTVSLMVRNAAAGSNRSVVADIVADSALHHVVTVFDRSNETDGMGVWIDNVDVTSAGVQDGTHDNFQFDFNPLPSGLVELSLGARADEAGVAGGWNSAIEGAAFNNFQLYADYDGNGLPSNRDEIIDWLYKHPSPGALIPAELWA